MRKPWAPIFIIEPIIMVQNVRDKNGIDQPPSVYQRSHLDPERLRPAAPSPHRRWRRLRYNLVSMGRAWAIWKFINILWYARNTDILTNIAGIMKKAEQVVEISLLMT